MTKRSRLVDRGIHRMFNVCMSQRRCSTKGCARIVTGKNRKCMKHLKTTKYPIQVLRAGRRGRNKTGIAAHKPDKAHTRKAKRQHTHNLGLEPQLAITHWRNV